MTPYQLLADILDYPGPRLPERVRECLALLPPPSAELLRDFEAYVAHTGEAQREELYTSTFDMRAECSLYVGYQIFGEDQRRSLFMAKLREDYHTHHFSDGGELPDHLPVLLRYLAVREVDDVREDLIVECVLPALKKLTEALASGSHPYTPVLKAVSALLEAERSREPIAAAAVMPEPRLRG
jgi:nitrate reductase delta subunit